jgi:protein-S-isoprenylcysteine O-methyltransferase Ste14
MLLGRVFFAVQAVAGAAWWIAVALVPVVRAATLGSLDPVSVAVVDIPLFVVASALAALGVRAAAWVSTGWTALVAVALAIYATVTTEAGWGVLAMVTAAGASMLALALVELGRIPTEWIMSGPFAARPARRDGRHGVMTTVQLVLFWGTFLGVIPLLLMLLERRWGLVFPLPPVAGVIGVIVLVLASALGIATAVSISRLGKGTPLPSATATRLVVAGPYRFVRNPMAISGIVQGAAVGLVFGSWLVIVYALAGSLLWNYAVRPHEEHDLEERFGDEYRRYRGAVRCWVPRFIPRSVSSGIAPAP